MVVWFLFDWRKLMILIQYAENAFVDGEKVVIVYKKESAIWFCLSGDGGEYCVHRDFERGFLKYIQAINKNKTANIENLLK